MLLRSRRPIVIKLSIILALVTGVVLANSGGPQLAKTGGFGENSCVECHNSFQVNSGGGSVSISGLPPNGYTPDTEYSLAVTVSKSGQLRWGFELAARFQDGGNQAGSLIAGNGTQVRTGGPQNVQYISHNAPGTWAGTQDSGSWSFKWHSPAAGSGPVQFNVAANAANNDGRPTGDYIYTGIALVTEAVSQPPACSNQPNNTYFAQFANGGTFVSKLILTNPGTTPVDACIDVRDNDGAPLSIGLSADPATINPSGVFSIPPGGTVVLTSDGRDPLVAGSVRVGSSATIGGVVLFSFSGGTTGVGASVALTGFITPVERNTGVNTGLALVNTGDNPITLNLSLRRLDGTEAATAAPITILPHGHSQGFISDYFGDGTTANFRGSIVGHSTGGSVGATAVRIGNEFTTLPVTLVP